jgi:hypothetical protein
MKNNIKICLEHEIRDYNYLHWQGIQWKVQEVFNTTNRLKICNLTF